MPNQESQKTEEKSVNKAKAKDTVTYEATGMRHRPLRRPLPPKRVAQVDDKQQRRQHLDEQWVAEDLPNPVPYGNFREVDWPGIQLNGCDATGADFSAATLTDLCALGANFTASQFEEAQLQNGAFCGANLTQANFRHSDLRRANLSWATLRQANLFGVDLRSANLAWADLREANLREVNLAGAYYNLHTQWPSGFELAGRQMICLSEGK